MKVTETALQGVLLVEPQVFGDHRGWFMESYSKLKLEQWKARLKPAPGKGATIVKEAVNKGGSS